MKLTVDQILKMEPCYDREELLDIIEKLLGKREEEIDISPDFVRSLSWNGKLRLKDLAWFLTRKKTMTARNVRRLINDIINLVSSKGEIEGYMNVHASYSRQICAIDGARSVHHLPYLMLDAYNECGVPLQDIANCLAKHMKK